MRFFASSWVVVLVSLMLSVANAASPEDFKAFDLLAADTLPADLDLESVEVAVVPVETVLVNDQSVTFKYRACEPRGNPSGMAVLLLHGARFSSATWSEDIKTTQTLCALGHKVVAIDLPGFGGSPPCSQCDNADFLAAVLDRFFPVGSSGQLTKPAVVTPSMSGSFIFPYIRKYKDDLGIGSLITVAPVDVSDSDEPLFRNLQLPTLIVYGDRDSGLGTQSAKHLELLPLSTKPQVLKNSGHAAYLDSPDDWHKILANLLAFLVKDASTA